MCKTPYKDLLRRCEKIKNRTPHSIFLEASVDPANIPNWKSKESAGLLRWVKLVDSVPGVQTEPNRSTYSSILKVLKSKAETDELFLRLGFSKTLLKIWKWEDPQYIESYKRIDKVLKKYEKDL